MILDKAPFNRQAIDVAAMIQRTVDRDSVQVLLEAYALLLGGHMGARVAAEHLYRMADRMVEGSPLDDFRTGKRT